eukprot:15430450-Alexandrium_andersonii.AAC.1
MGVSDFRRFRAAERAVWLVGRAGTAAPSGWMSGPELALTSQQSGRLGVPTSEFRNMQNGFRRSNLELHGSRDGLKTGRQSSGE